MEFRDEDDRFSSLIALCKISDSQEDHLRLCPFAGPLGPDDNVRPPLCSHSRFPRSVTQDAKRAAAGSDRRNDAPKSKMDVTCDSGGIDDAKIVDLGRDTDVGLSSEVEFSYKLGHDVNRMIADKNVSVQEFCKREKFEVLRKDLSVGDALAESSSKRLKISDEILALELPVFSAGTTNDKAKEDLLKFYEALKSKIELVLVEMKGSNKNIEGESSEIRKSKASDNLESNSLKETENIQSVDMNKNIQSMSMNEDISGEGFTEALIVDLEMEDGEMRRVENGVTEKTENKGGDGVSKLQETVSSDQPYRILPPWTGKKKRGADELNFNEKEVTMKDVLKILGGVNEGRTGTNEDDRLADLSILEILQHRGMTFPRPGWWPERGFEESEEEDEEET